MMIEHADIPLRTAVWCVYGPDSFPTMLSCMVSDRSGTRSIWGYSVYKRSPGFRTLGVGLSQWAEAQQAKFFIEQSEALDYLRQLTAPKKRALEQLAQG